MLPTRRQRPWLAVLVALAAALLLGALACSGSSTTTVLPTTGILVRAENLTTGRGCGKNPENVFKYAVVVFGYTGGPETDRTSYMTPVTSNIFECFTDGAFIELDKVNGSSTFRLEVYAYNQPAFEASRAVVQSAGTDTSALKATTPTWTTQCTATQQSDVQVLALCTPLTGGLSGLGGSVPATRITLGTTRFHLQDGRTATCASNGDGGVADAGLDAEAGLVADASLDAADASTAVDASASDASADGGGDGGVGTAGTVTFTTARIRYRSAGIVGPTVDLACPGTFLADVAAEPARYDIDVGVLDSAGTPIGATLCSVTTQTGATSSAVCP